MLLLAAVAYGIYAAFDGAQQVGFLLAVGGFLLLLAFGVAVGARGMWRSQRWARSIALTWQVFQAGIGLAAFSAWPVLAIVLIAVALGIAGCVLARAGQDDAAAIAEAAQD